MEELKKDRAVLRRSATLLVEKVRAVLDGAEKSEDELVGLIRLAETKKAELEKVDKQLLREFVTDDGEPTDKLQEETEKCDEYMLKLENSVAGLMRIREKKLSLVSNRSGSSGSAGFGVFSGNQKSQCNMKLPKLCLPIFDGSDPTHWPTFSSQFTSAIHQNTNLSDVEKFSYLQSCLKGEAKRCVENLQLTARDYHNAWELLEARYGSRDNLVQHFMKKLEIVRCTSDATVALRSFVDVVRSSVRALESLGVSTNNYEVLLLPNLEAKLPGSIRADVLRSILTGSYEKTPTIQNFLEAIDNEVTLRERCAMRSSRQCEHSGQPLEIRSSVAGVTPKGSLNQDSHPSTFVTHHPASKEQHKTSQQSDSSQHTMSCTYCRQSHYSESCTVVPMAKERMDILKKERRCFCCLRPNHPSSLCRSKRACRHCGKLHHPSICLTLHSGEGESTDSTKTTGKGEARFHGQEKPAATSNCSSTANIAVPSKNPAVSDCQSFVVHSNPAVIMPTAKCIIVSSDGKSEVLVRALFDTASNKTYIRQDLSRQLGLAVETTEVLRVNTFGSSRTDFKSSIVRFRIRRAGSWHEDYVTLKGYTTPRICEPQASAMLDAHPEIQRLDLADPFDLRDADEPISVLIGADNFYDLVDGDVIRTVSGKGPVAVKSKLGYLVSGRLSISDTTSDSSTTCTMHCAGESLRDGMLADSKNYDADQPGSSKQDFPPNLEFQQGRYSIGLPFKEGHQEALSDNFNLAYRRLRTTAEKLRQTGQLDNYDKILQEQLRSGVIEPAPPDNDSVTMKHYLPHLPIVKEDSSTTRLRIVFDASAKTAAGHSLNDVLEQGPCCLPSVSALLLQFRTHPVALIADVEKAFLQIVIREPDRDAVRFLWLTRPHEKDSSVCIMRYVRLVFGLVSSPSILQEVLLFHLRSTDKASSDILQKLARDTYVDNLVTGTASASSARELYQQTREVFQEASMNIRGWISNSEELNSLFKRDGTGAQLSATAKVLGMQWDPRTDTFVLSVRDHPTVKIQEAELTKRSTLSAFSKTFDPLGLLSPLLTRPRLLFQQSCRLDLKWDSMLPEPLKSQWRECLNELAGWTCRIDRPISTPKPVSMEIHGFCDASQVAHAACIYLRSTIESGEVRISLLLAKSRVAPVAETTIPRLELMAAKELVQLIIDVRREFPGVAVTCWSDSMDSLWWIKSEHKVWKVFIQNRAAFIRSVVPPECWRHCPGKENPADIATRPVVPEIFNNQSAWFCGPPWLSADSSTWPIQPEFTNNSKSSVECTDTTCAAVDINGPVKRRLQIDEVIDVQRFSTMEKLLRVTAWALRFVKLLRSRTRAASGSLASAELQAAEHVWIRSLQEKTFSSEIRCITHHSAKTHLNQNLRLFLDQDVILRCTGRLGESDLTPDQQSPILCPTDGSFQRLLVEQAHRKVAHGGVAATLVQIREKYWMLKARQNIKAVLKNCNTCIRLQGLPYKVEQQSQLPSSRLESLRAFQQVGLDYCGPLLYRRGEGDGQHKAYILLFACMSTRAVHLEVVSDLTTQSFLQSLRRFCARRGTPSIISDNFKTFHAAARLLEAQTAPLQTTDGQEFLAAKRISWSFIPERAPWMGGFYERLVGVVKAALKKTVGKAFLALDELATVVCEAEAVVNSRPLGFVSSEMYSEVLTPSHFLVLHRLAREPKTTPEIPTVLPLPARLSRVRQWLTRFWREFLNEYVLALRERSVKEGRTSNREVKVGDVVLVMDKGVPRLQWKLAVVEAVHHGRDGVARSCLLRLASPPRSSRAASHLRRPVASLVPLET